MPRNTTPPPPGPGRPKGSQNRFGHEIRQAVAEALEAAGGKEYLIKLAKTKPQVFCGLVQKIIPAEVEVKNSSIIDDMGSNDIARLAELLGARIKGYSPSAIEGTDLPQARPVPPIH